MLSRLEREAADRGVLAVGGRRISRRANHGMAGTLGRLDLLHRTVVVLNELRGKLPLQGYWLGRKRHHGADCGD